MTSTRKPGSPGGPAPFVRRSIALLAAGALASSALVAATGSTVQADEVPPETRDLSFAVQQATTNPGQYQIAASEETDELLSRVRRAARRC